MDTPPFERKSTESHRGGARITEVGTNRRSPSYRMGVRGLFLIVPVLLLSGCAARQGTIAPVTRAVVVTKAAPTTPPAVPAPADLPRFRYGKAAPGGFP